MTKRELQMTVTLGDLLEAAAGLVDDPGETQEYERGILELLARTFTQDDTAAYERQFVDRLAERLDWPIGP